MEIGEISGCSASFLPSFENGKLGESTGREWRPTSHRYRSTNFFIPRNFRNLAPARAHSALRDRVNFPTSRRGIECNRITRSRRLISRNSKIIRSGGNRRGYLGGTTFRLEEDENRARSTDFYDLTPNPIYLYLGTWNLFLHREES